MSLTVDQIEAEAHKLTEEEQVELLHRLILADRQRRYETGHLLDPEWLAEIQRRSDRMESGEDPGIPAEDVFEEMKELLRLRTEKKDRPAERVQDLLGSLNSGQPDLAERGLGWGRPSLKKRE